MKRIMLILLLAASTSAVAQQVVLPWMPGRDTNHIRTIRHYRYDTVTHERKLHFTDNYDRHGYYVAPHIVHTYNDQGLLTQCASTHETSSTATPMAKTDTGEVWDIRYSPDGVVQRVIYKSYGYGYVKDTTTMIYELISHKVHPVFGWLDYTFKYGYTSSSRKDDVWYDTFYIRREYDDNGRLLRQYNNWEDSYEDISYHYRPDGRVEYRVGYYYESWDSLSYHYDANGVLTHMTGKLYDLDMEADVTIRCQPDGRRIEERQVWRAYDQEGESIENFDYDSHGQLLRAYIKGRKDPYIDCEIDYWE